MHNLVVKVLRPKLVPSMPAPHNGSQRMLVSFGPAPSEKGGGVSLFCGIACFRVRRRPLRTVALAIDWTQHLIHFIEDGAAEGWYEVWGG